MIQRLRRVAPDILAIVLLLVLPPFVFWAVWAPNPADRIMFGGDILMGAYPTRVFVHRLLELGELPLWNSYQLGGMPLLADVQVAVYYLPNLLLDAFYRGQDIPYIALELLVIAHYALGAIFLYAFLRGLGVIPAAALVGAAAFEFNGFFVGHRGHYNMLAVTAWAPGVLWLLDGAWRARSGRRAVVWAVFAGLALSQMVMAGHPQATLYCAAIIGSYAFWRGWTTYRRYAQEARRNGTKFAGTAALLRMAGVFVLAGVLAGGLAAITLLPTAELLGRSLRNEPTYAFAAQYSLLPRNLIGLLVPEFLDWSSTEFRIYAGILTLALAAVALLIPVAARPERRFFLVLLIAAFVLAMGGFTALQGIVYRFVPGFGAVRVSARAFYAANLALAVLAAFGAETLLRALVQRETERLQRLARGLGILTLLAGLIGVGFYVLLALNYRPVGEDFFFFENLFGRQIPADPYALLTRSANQYILFVLLLIAATVLIAAGAYGRLNGRGLALALVMLTVLDTATFAPQHDTIIADPETARFTIREYTTTMLRDDWQIRDQDQLIAALQQLPDGVRVDNGAEVLPDNYSAVWRIPFASGYNILDLRERFEILTQWPNLSDATRRDLLNVGYILTPADQAEAPEPGALLLVENSQGRLWKRARQPEFARFSTSIRPAADTLTINGLLNSDQPPDIQPTVSYPAGDLRAVLAQRWPGIVDPIRLAIGQTGVRSPVDIGVLAGGPVKYSAVIVAGKTVTPEQRGIVLAQIDPGDGRVIWAGGFDTYQLASESERLAVQIESFPAGAIVALATYDEGTAQLTSRARAALRSLGAAETLENRFGAAYALIGVKGAAPGTALERIGERPVTLDVGLGAAAGFPDPVFRYELLTYHPNQITLLVQNSAYGLLSISESDYPGWEAYIDGLPSPIIRANGLLRAVVLPPAPPGRPREVTFVYRPVSVRLGGAVSLLSLVLAPGLIVAALAWPKAGRAPADDTPGTPTTALQAGV